MTPATVANLKSQGVIGFMVTCNFRPCFRSGYFTFDALNVGDREEFPTIAARRRFVCSACGGRAVHVMPDWRDHRAAGVGGTRPLA